MLKIKKIHNQLKHFLNLLRYIGTFHKFRLIIG